MITINRIDCPDILKQGKNPKSKGELETIRPVPGLRRQDRQP